MTKDDVPRAKSQSIASSVDPDEPPAESTDEFRELMDDLRGLVQNYRSTARIFPDDSNTTRVATHCADKLEETIEEYENE